MITPGYETTYATCFTSEILYTQNFQQVKYHKINELPYSVSDELAIFISATWIPFHLNMEMGWNYLALLLKRESSAVQYLFVGLGHANTGVIVNGTFQMLINGDVTRFSRSLKIGLCED